MCGRYTLIKLSDFLEYFPWIEITNLITESRYNIAPSQQVAAITNESAQPKVNLLRWGLVPAWAKDGSITAGSRMINARAETLSQKPAFSRLIKRQRCLIPADGFYEWQQSGAGKEKIPYYFRLKNCQPFAFAGLWDRWRPHGQDELRTCTIITTNANSMLAGMHDRMPVILNNDQCRRWLTTDEMPAEEAAAMLQPYPAEQMETYPVSSSVNSPRQDLPQQIQPVEIPKASKQLTLFG